MIDVYINKPYHLDIIIRSGDTFIKTFHVWQWDLVSQTWVDYTITGVLDLHIRKKDGTLLRALTSGGGSPEITSAGFLYSIFSAPITNYGTYKYDLQETIGSVVKTLQYGKVKVSHEITV